MWILLAGIFLCYLFGFFVYFCYHTARKRSSSPPPLLIGVSDVDVENAFSGSILSSLQPDGRVRTTLVRNVAVGQEGELGERITSCLYFSTREAERNSDLPQSALAAHREQQLRQIKLEINELSRRLGIGQLYRERQLHVQEAQGRRSAEISWRSGEEELSDDGTSSSSEEASSSLENSSTLSRGNSNSCSSSVIETETFSPIQTFTQGGGGDRIFHQRQRRLRLIRMEIEDLTLQLSNLQPPAASDSIQPRSSREDVRHLSLHISPLRNLPPTYEESLKALEESPPPSYAQVTKDESSALYNRSNISQLVFYSEKGLNKDE